MNKTNYCLLLSEWENNTIILDDIMWERFKQPNDYWKIRFKGCDTKRYRNIPSNNATVVYDDNIDEQIQSWMHKDSMWDYYKSFGRLFMSNMENESNKPCSATCIHEHLYNLTGKCRHHEENTIV